MAFLPLKGNIYLIYLFIMKPVIQYTNPYVAFGFALLLVCLLQPVLQAQNVVVTKWDGPWKDSFNWDYWRGTMSDGNTMWAFDNSQGIRKFGIDTNNDGNYEYWQEEYSIPDKPALLIHHWDLNQDSVDDAIAWAEAGKWIEKVWDSNKDGKLDSWCMYAATSCADYQSATKNNINLKEKKLALDNAEKELMTSANKNETAKKYAKAQSDRTSTIYRICTDISTKK
ncbi:hypothetical protein C7N43_12070 [Sphingobacteriales bacterium UPWRP_1]|nr:hypothetical protein BVG80_06040 [Sphingobacteriales bacterium TSM_CSM]PSJ76762.1 hypothetical protein C7N43_12070 [Sphingobacteriales bacterium UPWRP_1]